MWLWPYVSRRAEHEVSGVEAIRSVTAKRSPSEDGILYGVPMTSRATAEGDRVGKLAIDVREIGVRYGGVRALSSVSLTARHGEVVGLIGPNGAGKTTLFDAISGLARPAGGSIHFESEDVTKRSSVWRARWGLRRTFQRQQVFDRLTVEDNLLSACEWKGGGGGMVSDLVHLPTRTRLERQRREEVAVVLEVCGLTKVKSVRAGALPIASARLLELGRALMGQPKILLLDEPTSGLGDAEVDVLRRVLATLRQDGECAVLLVEHDINFVMAESAFVYALTLGSVLSSGTPQEIRDDVAVREAYLG
jgi:branched-chain amino acid transport system ATP-binding protein